MNGYYLVHVELECKKKKTKTRVYASYKSSGTQWTTYSSWSAVALIDNEVSVAKTIKPETKFIPIKFTPDGKEYLFLFFQTLKSMRAFARSIIPVRTDIDFGKVENQVDETNQNALPKIVDEISKRFVVHTSRINVNTVIFKSLGEYIQTMHDYNPVSFFVNYVIVQGDNLIKIGYSDGPNTESRFAMYDTHLPTIPRFMIIMIPKDGVGCKPDESIKREFAPNCTKTVLLKNNKEWIKNVDFRTVFDRYAAYLRVFVEKFNVQFGDIHTEFFKDKYSLS